MDFGKYGIKALKTWMTDEGGGWALNLTYEGKVVAYVLNHGDGGMVQFDWKVKEAEGVLKAFVATLPALPADEKNRSPEIPMSDELFVCVLLDEYESNKRFKRQCKTKTLFTVVGDKEGSYKEISAPYTPEIKAFIVSKYGDKVKEIINERF